MRQRTEIDGIVRFEPVPFVLCYEAQYVEVRRGNGNVSFSTLLLLLGVVGPVTSVRATHSVSSETGCGVRAKARPTPRVKTVKTAHAAATAS